MADKSPEVNTQFYLVLPTKLPENIETSLQKIVSREQVVSMMVELSTALKNESSIKKLITMAQDENVAVLLGVDQQNWEQGLDFVIQWGCDGLHLLEVDCDVKTIRETLGQEYILGSFCGMSRHHAMRQGESNVHYIAAGFDEKAVFDPAITEETGQEIDPIIAFIEWYVEVFELPVVVWDCPTLEMAQKFIVKGADFIVINDIVWGQDVDPAEVMARLEALGA